MASRRHPTTMEKLPGEVISDIFIRLLAKQAAQMRCVCKSWNALLSESSFVKSHLDRSIHNKGEILLFFYWEWGLSFDCNPFTACLSRSPNLELTNFIKIPVIPQHKRSSLGRFIGSVNGLICFFYGPVDYRSVHIWNPSLSVMLTLPPSSFPSRQLLMGFGFDPKTDDYKVVKKDEVYSMRKGSWDLISQKFTSPISVLSGQNQASVDGLVGHLHWLGSTRLEWKPETIVAFDLCAETFREIPLPDSIIGQHEYRWNVLGVLAGKLCVMSCAEGGKCEIWVMDKYGLAESWIKNHVFSQFGGEIYPYGFTSRSEFLFQVNKDDRFHLYDPVAAKTETFKIMGRRGVGKVVEHVDSLVWVAPDKHDRGCNSITQFQLTMDIRGML